jgi:chemotaxis signal transduction protein
VAQLATTAAPASEPVGELRSGALLDLPAGGALHWLVPAGVSAHWQHRPAVWRLPGAPPGVRGIVYWLGRLAPVFDVALWLAPDEPARPCEHVLLLALPEGPAALRVTGAPDLVSLDVAPASVPPPTPALAQFLRGRRRLDGGVAHEFDVESWLRRLRTASPAQPAPGATEAA